MERIIFHIDVNNAFLSWTAVYLLNHGEKLDIRTIPSIIAGDAASRHGIVLAKSPVAKKYGVVTAEPIFMAKRKCPNLKVYPPMFEEYGKRSRELMKYLEDFSPSLEQFSIDECFLDMSNMHYLYEDVIALAYKMKDEIKKKFGYTVNIGIGNNKLCAKMAGDFSKPDKVHTLFMSEIESKMWPLPIEDLLFIGKSSSAQLHKLGINTIGDLAKTSESYLKKYFKKRSLDMIKSANGIDDSEVTPYIAKNKCISISRTLIEDVKEYGKIKKILLDMADQVGLRARKHNLYAQVIAITIKTASFKNFSHQKKITNATNNTMDIYKVVLEILDEIELKEPVRNIGIRLSDLSESNGYQISLFENNKQNDDQIQKVLDDINLKYKNTKIMPAIFYKK